MAIIDGPFAVEGPTARQSEVLGQSIVISDSTLLGIAFCVHVAPPFVVVREVVPTAMHAEIEVHETLSRPPTSDGTI